RSLRRTGFDCYAYFLRLNNQTTPYARRTKTIVISWRPRFSAHASDCLLLPKIPIANTTQPKMVMPALTISTVLLAGVTNTAMQTPIAIIDIPMSPKNARDTSLSNLFRARLDTRIQLFRHNAANSCGFVVDRSEEHTSELQSRENV